MTLTLPKDPLFLATLTAGLPINDTPLAYDPITVLMPTRMMRRMKSWLVRRLFRPIANSQCE